MKNVIMVYLENPTAEDIMEVVSGLIMKKTEERHVLPEYRNEESPVMIDGLYPGDGV